MTGGALAGVGTLYELAAVSILVTVRTLGERDLLFEIAAGGVALFASHFGVFALEWILGLGVIEIIAQVGAWDLLPPAGGVARLTALVFKAALVGIGVTVFALAKGYTPVAGSTLCVRRMTLLALHLLVQSGKRIAGLVVIELS